MFLILTTPRPNSLLCKSGGLKRTTAIPDVHLALLYARHCANNLICSNSFNLHDNPIKVGTIFTHFTDGETKVQKDINKYSQGFSTSTHKTDSSPDLPHSRALILTSGILCGPSKLSFL